MKMRAVCLTPGRAESGMTLAEGVENHEGHTLLVAGTVLDSEMLEHLIHRGVETLHVLVPDLRDEATIALELRAAEERIAHIFRGEGGLAREALRCSVLHFRQENTQ